MPAKPPSARPRMSGGFNPGMGVSNEHLDEDAAQAAAQTKSLGQQAADPGAMPTAGLPGGGNAQSGGAKQQSAPQKPRDVSPKQEITWAAQDIKKGLGTIFDLNALFGISTQDTPEQQAKKKQMHQTYQKMNQDEREVAQEQYQKEMEKKQREEEEKQQQKQELDAQQSQYRQAPSSPQKGPVGPSGSRKQKAQTNLQQQRQSIGKVGGSH